MKASVAIFQKVIEEKYESCPEVPDVVFEVAQRVIEQQNTEIVKTEQGNYIITYVANGPWQEKIGDEWLPVYIIKPLKWNSGGIKVSEMEAYAQKD